jgi:hypothetical protein
MNFDLATITKMVTQLAAMLIPGWTITVELAQSVEANQGALAMVYSTPERELAHVVVAPHPPNESPLESVAHELTHSCISPLTKLIEWSPAAVMLEEQIVERIGKTIARVPLGMARAISKALQNPRTNSPALRKRMSALATRRRDEGKSKMADGSRLAELAMKAGEMGAREDVPDDVRALLAEFVAELAGGSASGADPAMAKDPAVDPAKSDAPTMREDDMPPKMRVEFQRARKGASMMLTDTIRMRLHTARTIDNIVLDAATENDLKSCDTIEQFEREFKLVTRSRLAATETQRKRSGVVEADETGANGSPSVATLTKDGHSAEMAGHIIAEFKRGKEHGDVALESAMRFRKVAP